MICEIYFNKAVFKKPREKSKWNTKTFFSVNPKGGAIKQTNK